MKLRRATLLPTFLAVALVLLPAVGARAAVPPSFFGLEAKDLYAFSSAYRAAEFPKVVGAGAGILRQEFNWATIEQQPGQYKWGNYDALVREAAKHGIEVMPMLIDPPTFRASHAKGSDGAIYPPKNYADLGDFGAAIAHRYGPNGSFWAANPSVPKVPVHRYELWNEPNIPRFWEPSPNAAQYVAMVKAAAPRIRAADSSAEIISAGISEPRNPCCVPLRTYLAQMYGAGARGVFDSIALHPYWETAEGVVGLVEAARQIMSDGGDSKAGLWITEVGWATGGDPYRYNTDEAGQAARLTTLYRTLVQRRCELGMRGVVWTMWRDQPPGEWTQYTGLERSNGSAKPAFEAYRAASNLTGPDCPSDAGASPGPSTHDFAGVNAPELISTSSALRKRGFRSQMVLGVGTLRQVFNWRSIERSKGHYRLARYDRLAIDAAENGITLLPVITKAPRRYRSLRARRAGIARLGRALVKRYGPKGTLWRKGVASQPIRSWQIWQDPNARGSWGGRPSARAYVGLLRAARRAIRKQDRGAKIVSAALARRRGSASPLRFISSMYRAGGKRAFDVLGLAPYSRSASGVLRQARAARRLMVRRGQRRGKLWIVSFGWADRGPRSSFRVGRKGQATRIRATLGLLARNKSKLALRGVVYAAWRDKASSGPRWTRYAGLLDSRRREKPAFAQFKAGLSAFR